MDTDLIIKLLDEQIDSLRKSRDIEGQDWTEADTEEYGREYGDTYNAGFLEGGAHVLSQLRKQIQEGS